jgi:NAD kinase
MSLFSSAAPKMYFLAVQEKHSKKCESLERYIRTSLSCGAGLECLDACEGILVLGGDGTMLRTLREIRMLDTPPVYGFNFGVVGCLYTFSQNEFEKVVEMLRESRTGQMEYFYRKRLKINNEGYFLNEVIVTKKKIGKLNSFILYINDIEFMKVKCDSVIVSTPTGSSAYNLSAGGPVVHGECDVIIVNMVCPSRMVLKSMVFPIKSKIGIHIEGEECEEDCGVCIIDGCDEVYNVNDVLIQYDGSKVPFAYFGSTEVIFKDICKKISKVTLD